MPTNLKNTYAGKSSEVAIILLLLLIFLANCKSVSPVAQKTAAPIFLADPTIFAHGGSYYLYGTVEGKTAEGFRAYRSKDLQNWQAAGTNNGYALQREDVFGTTGFWAPQVFVHNKKFLMAYVANENIAIAESRDPAGPFVQRNKVALQAPVKQIDPFVFTDDDGKIYLYHVRLTEGNRIMVAEMTEDLSAIKPETLQECITATDGWENTANAPWPVAEGPTVIKHKDLYYLVYSANDFRNPDYAVGYATSSSPLGPWKKFSGNPIIHKKQLGENGPGHGDLFQKGNTLYYVLHTHNSVKDVGPRKTAVVKMQFVPGRGGIDQLAIDSTSFRFFYQ